MIGQFSAVSAVHFFLKAGAMGVAWFWWLIVGHLGVLPKYPGVLRGIILEELHGQQHITRAG